MGIKSVKRNKKLNLIRLELMPTFQIQIQNWNEIKWNYYNFKEPNYKTKGAIFKLFMVLLSDIQIHNYNMQGEVKRLIKQGGEEKKITWVATTN